MVWIAGGPGPIQIFVNMPLATGSIKLTAKDLAGNVVPLEEVNPTDAPVGDRTFNATLAQPTFFKLVAAALSVNGAAADVALAVRKGGAVVRCEDNAGKVLNKKGGGYKMLSLGKVKLAENLVTEFAVEP